MNGLTIWTVVVVLAALALLWVVICVAAATVRVVRRLVQEDLEASASPHDEAQVLRAPVLVAATTDVPRPARARGQELSSRSATAPPPSSDPLEDENHAIAVVQAYARAVLTFQRAAGTAERDRAVVAVRRAGLDMAAVYGMPGEPGTYWPIPVGAPVELLEEIEWRCQEALRRRREGVYAVRDSVEAAAILARRPGAVPAARRTRASRSPRPAAEPPREAPVPAPPEVPTPVERPAAALNESPAPPFQPDKRLEFARWLVQTGRLSEQ